MAVTAVVGAVSAVSSYSSYRNQQKQQKQQLALQRQANADAKQRAKMAQDRSDMEQNKANRRKADVGAIQDQEAAMGGGTMLTGTKGVDPNKLNLGGKTDYKSQKKREL